jgi:cephalosporin hydroxylase
VSLHATMEGTEGLDPGCRDLLAALIAAECLDWDVGRTAAVYALLKEVRPDFICEWGTNTGHSARFFHEARTVLGLKCEIHSIELADGVHVLRAEDRAANRSRGTMVHGLDVHLHVGNGPDVARELCEAAAPKRPLFFIDCNHEEAAVRDALATLAGCSPREVFLLDDALVAAGAGVHVPHGPGRAAYTFAGAHPEYVVEVTAPGESFLTVRRQ